MSSRTFSLDSDSTVYARVAADLRSVEGWSESKKGDVQADVWLVDGRKKGVASSVHALLGQSGRAQLVNYCRGSTALTLKSSMIRTLRGYLREQELDQEAMGVPTTFVVYPKRGDDAGGEEENAGGNSRPKSLKEALAAKKRAQAAASDERSDLLAHVLAAGKEGGAREDTAPIWIAKASAGGKGEGICISRSCDKLLQHVDSSPSDTAWVVSRYLQDPMLIDGRKFDVRCWVLLDAKFRVFVFQDGVARTTSYQYDLSDLSNPLQHLTNHCIQAQTAEFEKFEVGNELSFPQLDTYVTDNFPGQGWFKDVVPQMHALINLSFAAVREKMAPVHNEWCHGLGQFQLFGFDFLVDAHLKVWLLEINGSPASRELLLPHMSRALIRTAILGHFRDVEAAAGTEHLRDSVATAMSASTQQGHGKGDSVEELRSAPEFGNERGNEGLGFVCISE